MRIIPLGYVAITAAGTPQAIPTTETRAAKIEFATKIAETDKFYLGDTTLNKTSGAGVIKEMVAVSATEPAFYVLQSSDGVGAQIDVPSLRVDGQTTGKGAFITLFIN
jgi:hypothetical protein